MDQLSDSDLIIQVQNGDIRAFETVVKRYQQKLFAFVCRIVFEEHTAEEIVQDALFLVYTHIDTIDTKKKFSTFLFEIAKNKAIDYLRGHKKTVPLGELEIIDEDISMYESMIAQDQQRFVKELVAKLPQQYQNVITLYYFDDCSYEEIAQKLSLPINTIRTHLRRAKAELLQLGLNNYSV